MDDVELVTTTVYVKERQTSSNMDYVATDGVIIQERRDTVSSTVESQVQEEANATVRHLLDNDGSQLCDEEQDKSQKDKTRKEDAIKSGKLGYNKFMLEDVWKVGCVRLKKANLKKVCNDARDWFKRHQRIN